LLRVQDQSRTERLPQLDGVRGIAIILVLLWHYANGFWTTVAVTAAPGSFGANVLTVLSLSWSGVDLFFVLSGYLIGGILLDHGHDQNGFRVFYARRSLRIVPLYLLVLMIGLIYGLVDKDANILYYLTFTQNIWMAVNGTWAMYWNPTWSIAVEVQFYLALPLLVWLLPRKWVLIVLVSLVAAAPIFRIISLNLNPIAPHILLPCRIDALLCGVLCAYAMRHGKMRQWIFRNTITLYSALGVLLIWPALATMMGWGIGSHEMESFGLTLLAFTYACFLLLAIVEKTGPIAWLTSLSLLRRFGLLAYCIYLIHTFVPSLVFRVVGRSFSPDSGTDWTLLGVSFLIVVCIAQVSWRFFEQPLIRWGHRWRYSGPKISPQRAVAKVSVTLPFNIFAEQVDHGR
jgi:peptidoglycan/LPS O-acetylase OafA/YrhL